MWRRNLTSSHLTICEAFSCRAVRRARACPNASSNVSAAATPHRRFSQSRATRRVPRDAPAVLVDAELCSVRDVMLEESVVHKKVQRIRYSPEGEYICTDTIATRGDSSCKLLSSTSRRGSLCTDRSQQSSETHGQKVTYTPAISWDEESVSSASGRRGSAGLGILKGGMPSTELSFEGRMSPSTVCIHDPHT